MKHLTMTGQYAGRTYCGADREGRDDGVHGAYLKMEWIEARATPHGPLCPECCKVAVEAFAVADDETGHDDEREQLEGWKVVPT